MNPNADTPVTGAAPQEQDTPVDPLSQAKFSLSSDHMKKAEALQAAAMDAVADPEKNIASQFQNILSSEPDTRAALQARAFKHAHDEVTQYLDQFTFNPGETPEDIQANHEATQSIVADIQKEAEDPDLQYVRAVSDGDLTPEEEKRVAVNLAIAKMMKDTSDATGMMDSIGDVFDFLIPGGQIKDNIDLTGSAFNAKEWMRRFVLNFKQLPPERQLDLLPTVKAVLTEKLDNHFKVLQVLNDLMQPGGEDDLEQFDKTWAVLDAADAATLGGTLLMKTARLAKTLNAVRILKSAGRKAEAASINAGAVVDSEIAANANLDNLTAVNNATGVNTGVEAAYTEGLAEEAQRRIRSFSAQTAATASELSQGKTILKEDLLSTQERDRVESAAQEILTNVPRIENVRIVGRGPAETTFAYDAVSKSGLSTTAREVKLPLSLNDVGTYEQSRVALAAKAVLSPSVWAKGTLREEVSKAVRADSANASTMRQLTELQRQVTRDILGPLGLKGITRKGGRQLAELDHVLRVGDKRKAVFTPVELRAGIDGVPLNDKQIEAYYKMRSLIDNLYMLRNNALRDEHIIRGNRGIWLAGVEGRVIGKPGNTVEEAKGLLSQVQPHTIWDAENKVFVRRSKLALEDRYSEGARLVKLIEPLEIPGTAERSNMVLVKQGDIQAIPARVMPYRIGYVPKINLNAHYFVKESFATRLNGVDIPANTPAAQRTTIRIFDKKADADKWLAEYKNRHPNSTARVEEDRQLEKELRGLGGAQGPSGGGLFTGARASEDIPFGLEGKPLDTLGVFESISRNIASVSKFIPRNVWRMGMQQRALNTAQKLMPDSNFTHFDQLANAGDTQAGRFVKALHTQISDWMGIPSAEETRWEALVQWTYEKMGTGLVGKGLNRLRGKDPVATARAAAFHTLLGWFNPVQLFVQAQGASVAAGVLLTHPGEIKNVVKLQAALSAVDNIENAKAFALTAKAFGMKTEELMAIKKLWRRTGLRDAILTTADHAAAIQGHPISSGVLSRVANKGLLFYRAGELFNRRVSFITALQRYKKLHPEAAIDDRALKSILSATNDFMLNLTRANRAAWQKGVLGVPTQFLQITTKTLETAVQGLRGVHTTINPGEMNSVIATQALLYGAAGIPLGGMGVNLLAQALGYRSQANIESLDPELVKAVNEGFEGWLTMKLFGIDIDVGTRLSLSGGITQFLHKLMFEDSTIPEMWGGAFGTSTSKFWRGFTEWQPMFLGGGLKSVDPLAAFSHMAQAISTWDSVSKAYFMHRYNVLLDKHGNVVRRRDFTPSEEIARAIGFHPSEETKTWTLSAIQRAKQEFRGHIIDTLVNYNYEYAIKIKNKELTPEIMRDYNERKQALMSILDTPHEREIVRKAVFQKLTTGKDKYSRLWRTVRQEWADGQGTLLESWKQQLISRGLLQQASPENQENQ